VASSKLSPKSPVASWWLSPGDEECPHCSLTYVIEVEFRCAECDAPSCPHCGVHVEGHYLCPDCILVATNASARSHDHG
jgi:transposase-like protein